MTHHFKSGTQYGDLKGSATADNSDNFEATSYLKKQELISEEEIVLALEFSIPESDKPSFDKKIYVSFYVNEPSDISKEQQIEARHIELELSLGEFFGFFKRFSATLSLKGAAEGKDIEIIEN